MRLLLLFICLSQTAFGQLSGKLVTAASQPVPFANVILLKDSTIIRTTLTDENGIYRIDGITPGKYILRFSGLGYHTTDFPVADLTNRTDIIAENTKVLGEVVVKGDKPLIQQQPDGMVVNVENSVLTKGSSVLSVLERSPGVMIDEHNHNISLNGKTGVIVMLNGKLVRMTVEQVITLLSSMPADNLEKIELLTTPPSKYDAEGSAGMINIVVKKNKLMGTSGSLTLTAGYGKREKGSGSINLARNTGKVDLYAAYSFSRDKGYGGFTGEGYQFLPSADNTMRFKFANLSKPVTNSHNVTVGTDVVLNPAVTIGASVNYNNSRNNTWVNNRGEYAIKPDSFFIIDSYGNNINRWRNLTTSGYIKGKNLSLDIDYLNYNNSNPTSVISTYYDKAHNILNPVFTPLNRGFSATKIQVGIIKADYTKQFNTNLKLETGVKFTLTDNVSISGIESYEDGKWKRSTETFNNVTMREGIGAAYASLNILSNIAVGLRYEYSRTKMNNNVDRKLGKLFPNISYTKKLNEQSEIQLSYTKRISRPSYNDLASYFFYIDPFAVFTGNPLLKPTITNNFKIGYNLQQYTFSLLLSHDEHPIVGAQLTKSPNGQLVYISPQNVSWQRNLTFQTTLPFKVNNWWNMSYSLTGGWRQFKLDYTVHPTEKTYFYYSLNFSQTFRLPAEFIFELSGWYHGPSYYGTIKNDARAMINAGVKRGNFQLSVADIFRIGAFHTYFGRLTEEIFQSYNHVTVKPESSYSPVIKLSYSRTFGGGMQERKDRAKDEKDRIPRS